MTMGDPRADRAMAAILPFVTRWGFAVNPEDVEEIVGAMLPHSDSVQAATSTAITGLQSSTSMCFDVR